MDDPHALAGLIDRLVEGDPWHAQSVAALLHDITLREAAARPVEGAHTIWEIVLHMTAWAHEVQRRLEGRAAQEPEGGDWPPVGAVTWRRWQAAVAALLAAHRELAHVVRSLDAAALAAPVVDHRDRALGTGLARGLTVHGLIHHTAYHGGQIALLKTALRATA